MFDRSNWPIFASIALGIWSMVAPAVLDYGPPASNFNHIAGPLIIAFSVIALWEATRLVRHANVLFAVVLLISPIFADFPLAGAVNNVLVGLLVIGLLFIPVKYDSEQFGGGWSAIWRSGQ